LIVAAIPTRAGEALNARRDWSPVLTNSKNGYYWQEGWQRREMLADWLPPLRPSDLPGSEKQYTIVCSERPMPGSGSTFAMAWEVVTFPDPAGVRQVKLAIPSVNR